MRARNIKPAFYKNEELAECSMPARLLFPGLWMLADREGRLEDRPKRFKGELFPYDNIEIEPLLVELDAQKMIVRYEKNGKRFIHIPTFKEHQRPHPNEVASEIPPESEEVSPKEESASNQGEKHSALFPVSCFLNPESSPYRESAPARSSKNSRKGKEKTKLPEDFKPPDEWRDSAVSKGFSQKEAARMWRIFRDHYLANGASFENWQAKWREWVERQVELKENPGKFRANK